jgi:DNA-binding NarL/FixJ family response regulator
VAKDMSSAVKLLEKASYKVVVTDIMMPSGPDFPGIDSSRTGIEFALLIENKYPDIYIICLSVIGDIQIINSLKRKGILYLRKGETSLETASNLIESKARGYSSF